MAKKEAPEITAIRQNNDHITTQLSGNLPKFANKLVQKGFIAQDEASGILGIHGIKPIEKASQLLHHVLKKLEFAKEKKRWFESFVDIFSGVAAYEDLVGTLEKSYKGSKYLGVLIMFAQAHNIASCGRTGAYCYQHHGIQTVHG